MILLAFLLPLAMYLLILGSINRRRHPLLVSGPWDFVGVLFAASGFLLFGGPGALSVLNDRWRESLVFGQNPSSSSATESLWHWWLLLMLAYFVIVVGGSALLLWRSRHQTSLYNVDPETVETLLNRIFERLEVRPLHSGDLYYFGTTKSGSLSNQAAETAGGCASLKVQTLPVAQNVILEVETFRRMWHVTLRWEPAHSPVRQEIERELERELAETPVPAQLLGGWLTVLAIGLFLLAFLIGFAVVIYRIVNRQW